MKNLVFIISAVLSSLVSFTQTEQPATGESAGFLTTRYNMRKNQVVYLSTDNTQKRIWGKRLRFQVTDESGDTIFVRFNSYTDNATMKKDPNYQNLVNETNINNTFYVLKGARQSFKYYYSGVAWGIILAPIKIRPQITYDGNEIPLKLTTNISIGPYLGYQWGVKRYSRREESSMSSTFLAFASPYTSFTEINTSNAKDVDQDGTTVTAFSLGGGYLFEISERFQAGFLIGWDWVGGDLAKKWYYQGEKWYSIAIGFNFRKR